MAAIGLNQWEFMGRASRKESAATSYFQGREQMYKRWTPLEGCPTTFTLQMAQDAT